MKRSEINHAIKRMEALIARHSFALPPFAFWTPADWALKGREYDEIRENALGWDITDCGLGKFAETGFAIFTIRNGQNDPATYRKPYAEKLLMLEQGQGFPMHYHWYKMEDIINRGGNVVRLRVYNGGSSGERHETDVEVSMDGRRFSVPAGTVLTLHPGESITMTPYLYHDFQVPETGGPVLLGEVSMCNDDETDNCFYEPVGRFPTIEEDEEPYRYLCNEYPSNKL